MLFRSPGRVLHSGLQGGSSRGIGLTAYVLLTFIETANSSGIVDNVNASAEHQAVIDKGLQYLVAQATGDSRDVYGLVLTSYVLELANHPKRDQVRALVEKHAITSTDGKLLVCYFNGININLSPEHVLITQLLSFL